MYKLIEDITNDVSELNGMLDDLNSGHINENSIVQSSIRMRRHSADINGKLQVLRKAVNQYRINSVQSLQDTKDAQKEIAKNNRIVELEKELKELKG